MSGTPETDALDQEPHNHRLLQNRYIEIRTHAQNMERERNQLKSIVEQRLVAGATIHQNANDLMRRNDRIKSERDEAISKYNNSIKIIRLLIKEIERPAYKVDDVIDRMSLMENAKKLVE